MLFKRTNRVKCKQASFQEKVGIGAYFKRDPDTGELQVKVAVLSKSSV
jgi:hypothetical protein